MTTTTCVLGSEVETFNISSKLQPQTSSKSITGETKGINSEQVVGKLNKGNTKVEIKKRKASYLAGQYPPAKRAMDMCTTTLWVLCLVRLVYNISAYLTSVSMLITFGMEAIIAALLADFISGIVHWSCDTWGTLDVPILGKTLIRSFREHHVDPRSIARHPFFETNGNSYLATLPLLYAVGSVQPENEATVLITVFLALFGVLVGSTNQFHKWSHTQKPPYLVTVFQNLYLILEINAHNYHHFSPYDRDYCITTGWLNPIFQYFGIWRKMENVITKYSGAVPREDDKLWTDAILKS